MNYGVPAPVSVVIPCYRCSATIGRAVSSVFRQKWRPAEIILVDDFSADDTLQMLRIIQGRYAEGWVRVIALSVNSGPGSARNVGWGHASQPYVAFLDSDDSWSSDKIAVQLGWMLQNPEVALTGYACTRFTSKKESKPGKERKQTIRFMRVRPMRLALSCPYQTSSVILRHNLTERFVEGKRYSEDFLLWAQIAFEGHPCYLINKSWTFRYKGYYGEGGITGYLEKLLIGEIGTYLQLYQERRFSRLFLVFFMVRALAAYAKRWIAALAYNLKK